MERKVDKFYLPRWMKQIDAGVPQYHETLEFFLSTSFFMMGGVIVNHVTISTGGINRDFDIIDPVFAIAGVEAGMFKGINPFEAFAQVKEALIKQCLNMGGDAVLFCQFEFRNALADGLMGSKQALEFFAYGTVVKLK